MPSASVFSNEQLNYLILERFDVYLACMLYFSIITILMDKKKFIQFSL